MSADRCVVFFGIRRKFDDDEIDSLEDRTHPLIVLARKNGLDHYWGFFGEEIQLDKLIFIGLNIGVVGIEGKSEIIVAPSEFSRISSETTEKFKRAGIDEPPSLIVVREPDV